MSAENIAPLKAPMPYFGGKGRVAPAIWARFGNPDNYVEAFAGSLAVLLSRPHAPRTETVNDADGLLCNFWRALQHDPDAVAYHADWPVNEIDLHARHLWLLDRKADVERLLAEPDAYDAKVAGWWVWGASLWIGSGWCSGEGPWRLVDGRMVKGSVGAAGAHRKRPHLMTDGKGVARQAPRLTGAQGVQRQDLAGVARQRPHLSHGEQGVNRKLPHLSHGSRGDASAALAGPQRRTAPLGTPLAPTDALYAYLRALAERLRRVRVCCGDWSRVVTPAVTVANGLTAVLLDPPYSGAERQSGLYAVDSDNVAADVRRWAVEHGDDPRYRIALCGYDGEHAMPEGWTALRWKAHGGYGSQGEGRGRENAAREIVHFSPHCLAPERRQSSLFDLEDAS